MVPMDSFNTIAKKPHQILMPYMADSFHLHPKFFLSLTPEKVHSSTIASLATTNIPIVQWLIVELD